ncbi:MAG: TonB-dependent receptor, partial [Caulobacterales bacterium]|nr:TonB-dependent receptor [Caulobacterales bacterium]
IIVVTARKREEDVLDVPISMTVFGAQEIQNSNITELRDYAVRTPNLSFSQNGNRGRTNFQIRGVGENTITGTGAAVGFYLDEFALNPTGNGQIDLGLVEIERIEVLRGPQGTLFGKNTIGGAINVVTRKPDGDFSGRLSASAERFGTYNVNGFVNVPLVDDRLAVQVSGFWRESDGFIENVTKGTSLGEGEFGGRVAVRAKPTDNLTIDVSALYSKIEADGLLAVAQDDFDAGDLVGRSDAPEFHEDELHVYYGRITYESPWFDAISITGYSDKDRNEGFDGDFGALSFFETLGIESSLKTFSQELRLQSNQPDARLQWTAGVNYADTEATNVFSLATGADWPFDPFGFSNPTSSDLQSIAGFGEANIRLLDPLTLTLGVRYSRDKATQISGETFNGEWDAWTPKFSLSYDVNDDWLVYGTVSRGYKPGGFDTAISPSDPVLEFEFDSETAWNYEVGVKGTAFDGRLIAEAAVFYLDWKDLQARFSDVFGDDFITNAASARSVGGELQLSLYPTENLFFQTGLGVINAEFTDFTQSPSGDLTGNAFRYIP